MLIPIVCVMLSTVPVPTPGYAILHQSLGMTDNESRQSEERALSKDMDGARKALGHKDVSKKDAPQTEPDSRESDIERAKGHLGHGHAEHKHRTHSKHHPGRYRRRKWVPPDYAPPMLNGNTKSHYMTWGIVDWSIAGGAFTSTLLALYTSIDAGVVASQNARLSDAQRYPSWTNPHGRGLRKRDYRSLSIASGIVSGLFAVASGVLAWRGASNISDYKSLHAQEEAELDALRKGRADPNWRW